MNNPNPVPLNLAARRPENGKDKAYAIADSLGDDNAKQTLARRNKHD